jgi:hypothetical protein
VSPRDPDLRLQDIAEAIDRIFDYTASHSLESFAADRMAVDAVVDPPRPRTELTDGATPNRGRSGNC